MEFWFPSHKKRSFGSPPTKKRSVGSSPKKKKCWFPKNGVLVPSPKKKCVGSKKKSWFQKKGVLILHKKWSFGSFLTERSFFPQKGVLVPQKKGVLVQPPKKSFGSQKKSFRSPKKRKKVLVHQKRSFGSLKKLVLVPSPNTRSFGSPKNKSFVPQQRSFGSPKKKVLVPKKEFCSPPPPSKKKKFCSPSPQKEFFLDDRMTGWCYHINSTRSQLKRDLLMHSPTHTKELKAVSNRWLASIRGYLQICPTSIPTRRTKDIHSCAHEFYFKIHGSTVDRSGTHGVKMGPSRNSGTRSLHRSHLVK